MLSLQSCSTLYDPWTVSHQAPLSMEFSRQEYWSGLPCPPPGYLPDPGIKPTSLVAPALQADSLPWNQPGKPRIKTTRRNINNLRYADVTTLMAEREELKSLLMKVKEESEKVSLKLNIQKTKIMASSLITSWQIYGKTMETVTDFIFWGSKITADGDCSHRIKRHWRLGRKALTNLDRPT